MPPAQRLVQRSRDAVSASPANPRRSAHDSQQAESYRPELPQYEPLTAPLSDLAVRQLDELFTNHRSKKYESHIGAAIGALTTTAGEGYDRIALRRHDLDKAMQQNPKDKSSGEDAIARSNRMEKMRQELETLEKQIDSYNENAETGIRALLDLREEAGSCTGVLRNVMDAIRGEEEGEEGTPISVIDTWKQKTRDFEKSYNAQSMEIR